MEVDILGWLDDLETSQPTKQVQSTPTQSLTTQVSAGTTFEMDRDVLLHMLEKAIGIVPSRDIIPVLTNFQLVVKDAELKVIASSSEMSIVIVTSQVETKIAGVEVFPARTFLNIVREAGSGSRIYVEVTASSAVIVSGGFSIEITLPQGSDFPRMESVEDVEFFDLNRLDFVKAISAVKYALPSKDFGGQDSLKMINIKNGRFTAFDGSRFQQVRVDGFNLNMHLPTWSINTLIKVLSSSDQETIQVGETSNRLVFKLNSIVFYMNKIEDPYPNVEQIWLRPALNNDQALYVNKQKLLTAIKQVRIAADTDSNAIALMLHENYIEVRAKATTSAAKTVVDCVWEGKEKALVVNYIHLAEMLKDYIPDECKFLLGEDSKQRQAPVLLKDDDTQAIATISQLLAYRAGLV